MYMHIYLSVSLSLFLFLSFRPSTICIKRVISFTCPSSGAGALGARVRAAAMCLICLLVCVCVCLFVCVFSCVCAGETVHAAVYQGLQQCVLLGNRTASMVGERIVLCGERKQCYGERENSFGGGKRKNSAGGRESSAMQKQRIVL